MPTGRLLKLPSFWLMIVLMICAGASETTMAQWASAFTESALGVSKLVGDLAGPCLFAVFMGLARVLYGKFSDRFYLTMVMLVRGVLCYLTASLSRISIIGLAGCALCGLAVGIMWPGTISISTQKCPNGGTALFAFLALAGDLGATINPAVTGKIADAVGGNLKIGLLFATLFPIVMIIGLLILRSNSEKRQIIP